MPKNQHFISKDDINLIGLVSIGLFSYVYSIFASNFAEVYFQPSFLDFPIFVGEFLLAFCVLLFLIRIKIFGFAFTRRYIVLGIYVVWMLLMAFRGYHSFGPLAFRNAALFYYPLFAVFGYVFYSKKLFTHPYFLLLPFLLGGTLVVGVVNAYFWIGYIILFTIIALRFKGRRLKWICIYLMVGFILFNRHILFGGNRSHLMGFIASFIFIVVYMLAILARFRLAYKVAAFVVMLVVLGLGILKFSDRNAVKSIVVPLPLIEVFKEYDAVVKAKKDDFSECELSVALYHDNRDGDKTSVEPTVIKSENKVKLVSQIKEAYVEKIVSTSRENITRRSEDIRKKIALLIEGSGDEFSEKLKIMLDNETKITLNSVNENVEKLKEEFSKNIQNNIVPSSSQNERPYSKLTGYPQSTVKMEARETAESLPKEIQGQPVFSSSQIKGLNGFFDREAARVVKNIQTEFEEKKIDALKEVVKEIPPSQSSRQLEDPANNKPGNRSLGIAYGNMLFRFLIWRDMRDEILEKKALWGINWGKPQRSKSLEMLRLAEVEWRRDGWITPHNSYFHIIYRAGVIGVFLIISFFVTLWRVIKDFARAKSVVGGLLIGIFIYWLTIANFLVFLEFPYNAIPFWSLFGLMLAYRDHLKEKAQEKVIL